MESIPLIYFSSFPRLEQISPSSFWVKMIYVMPEGAVLYKHKNKTKSVWMKVIWSRSF